MRNLKLVAALAAVVCIALPLGAGAASARANGNIYLCGYSKQVGKSGKVYLVLGVNPKSLGKTFCGDFNGSFKGKPVNLHKKLGTNHIYCQYLYKKSHIKVGLDVLADQAKLGKLFCKNFNPSGWKKY